MKKIIILLTLLCITACAANSTASKDGGNTITDSRDGKRYKVVKIGTQTWMAENLNYAAKGSKCYGEGKIQGNYENGFKDIILSKAEVQANCTKYGRLYDWETAKNVCPNGWHLPNDSEWDALYNAVGGSEIAETFLKSRSGWNDDTDMESNKKVSGNGEDKFGFAMLPGGTYGSYDCDEESGDECSRFGFASRCGFFSSTSMSSSTGYGSFRRICGCSNCTSSYGSSNHYLPGLFSVRCLQGEPLKVVTEKNTFADTRDSKNYKTVKISLKSGSQTIVSQTWMAENLNYNAEGSKCYDDEPANCTKYGRLYNWENAMKACPSGWHLPNKEEWDVLLNFADGEESGKKFKAKTGWNDNGTNDYGFAALPGGYGIPGGSFDDVGNYGSWWSSSENNSDKAYRLNMGDQLIIFRDYDDKSYLYSIRCIQD
jgi:uncharacterized protein (TIGR02145 family)